mgnify:CR=1 FL=1
MKSIQLSASNNILHVAGSDTTRSMDLKNVSVTYWPASGKPILLTVFDEKDIPIYNTELSREQASKEGTIEIGEKFVFYDHLSVQLKTQNEDDSFSLTLNFE